MYRYIISIKKQYTDCGVLHSIPYQDMVTCAETDKRAIRNVIYRLGRPTNPASNSYDDMCLWKTEIKEKKKLKED